MADPFNVDSILEKADWTKKNARRVGVRQRRKPSRAQRRGASRSAGHDSGARQNAPGVPRRAQILEEQVEGVTEALKPSLRRSKILD